TYSHRRAASGYSGCWSCSQESRPATFSGAGMGSEGYGAGASGGRRAGDLRERVGRRVHLVIVGAGREGAELLDVRTIPRGADEADVAGVDLRGERVRSDFLVAGD